MNRTRIAVIGGGIGGLSAAIALAQTGQQVDVIERSDSAHGSVYGVGIIQPMNALRALDAIGCAQACLDSGYQAAAWGAMYDVDGAFVRDIPGIRLEGTSFPPMNGVTRPRLHEILTARALEAGVRLRYGEMFVDLAQDADGVDAVLADAAGAGSRGAGAGERTERFDLLVGADGVSSRVRRHVIGTELRTRYIGQSAYRVNIPLLPEIDRIILQEGPAGMAGFVPIGPDLAYLFYNAEMPRENRPEGADLYPSLMRHLAPFGGLTARVRDEILSPDDDIVLRPEESLIAPRPWHSGRLVLMGDAVHAITPHLGQGAAQAIEDGVVLAETIAAHADPASAFEEYADRRIERCRLVVQTSLDIGEWEMGRRPGFDNVGATIRVLQEMAKPL